MFNMELSLICMFYNNLQFNKLKNRYLLPPSRFEIVLLIKNYSIAFILKYSSLKCCKKSKKIYKKGNEEKRTSLL